MRACLALGIALGAAVAAGAGAASEAGAGRSCSMRASGDTLETVGEAGDVRLASGLRVQLSELRWPQDPELRAAGTRFIAHRQGRRVEASMGSPDRWGRAFARIVVVDGASRLDLAHGLVEEGLALVDAGEADRLCAVELLALEATARERGLGLWASGRYKPVAADDLPRLQELVGSFALVEGRVRSVGERKQRAYLNFGEDWATDFTITIPKRSWTILRQRGVSVASLRGRKVRVRGVIDEWRGPALELVAGEMLELLSEDRGPGR